MTTRAQTQTLFHGTVILFGSMLTGFPLAGAIADGGSAEAVRAWMAAHSTLASTAILLIAVGAAGRQLALSARASLAFVWTMLPAAYGLCLGLVVTAITGQRGMQPVGPAINLILFVCNVVGVLGALVAGGLLVRGAYARLRAEAGSSVGSSATLETGTVAAVR